MQTMIIRKEWACSSALLEPAAHNGVVGVRVLRAHHLSSNVFLICLISHRRRLWHC